MCVYMYVREQLCSICIGSCSVRLKGRAVLSVTVLV